MTSEPRSFSRSALLLERALERIPLGSQTLSKSHTRFPKGASPLFLDRGEGGRVWDVDGNEYVDLICGLLPVLLGYRDPEVDAAIRNQLDRGISFSLATELEIELAERLNAVIPCAEMVRFGKNGSDATSAAVRLARAVTGRDYIVACGYHGWHDWYVGATARAAGVPQTVRDLTIRIPYGDLDAFRRILADRPGEVAGLVMEPMNAVEPAAGYLAGMRELAHEHGALFIFDEIITGFRYALGGAQELFGVTPDLAAFGKGLGNGMPISALAGRERYMRRLEEVFFSGTFGGEALSLAAAVAVVDKLRREPVIERLWASGARLAGAVSALLEENGLADTIRLGGKPCWTLLDVRPHAAASAEEIKAFLVTRGFRNGVLANNSYNICYAHSDADIDVCIAAYRTMLPELAALLRAGRLRQELGCEPVDPVLAVRPPNQAVESTA